MPCEGIEDFRIVVVILCVWRKDTPNDQHQHISNTNNIAAVARV
jgi:hypothetical protein